MQTYQIKVLPQGTCLYGGPGISTPTGTQGAILSVKNDRFGESVQITVFSQEPTQPVTTTDFGTLGPDQAFTINLRSVLRIEAKTLAQNLDSFVTCAVETIQVA